MDNGCDELQFGYVGPEYVSGKVLQEIIEMAALGQFDGSHHKDWALQQVIRIANGWSEETLQKHLEHIEWEPGIPP